MGSMKACSSETPFLQIGGVGGTVASKSALRYAGTLLSRVRAPHPAPWPGGGPESLRSSCCGLAIYKINQFLQIVIGLESFLFCFVLFCFNT
ncbi:hypothetical protein PoB_006603900 [Plakobranchus ocellatus]|uniref:Uncharacterized protein n=1 Tax=Plakobranchus ocellatus TaxID=259542 RepID=A0AAV4D5R3_9GAST|nr:hypothetical protein PoB_006603900 [Plakobranchus ocellatus]